MTQKKKRYPCFILWNKYWHCSPYF